MCDWKWDLVRCIRELPVDISTSTLEDVVNQALILRRLDREEGPPETLYNLALKITWCKEVLAGQPYAEFLESAYWKTARNYKLFTSDYQCEECGSTNEELHVHHKTYQFRGRELYHINTLQVLCKKCHAGKHNKTNDQK